MRDDLRMQVEEARAEGREPRVHPNGFLQLDLDESRRLHVWDESLPRQVVRTPIHDHVFTFRSRVILGAVTNVHLRLVDSPEGNFVVHRAVDRAGEETRLESTGQRVFAEVESTDRYEAGDMYDFPALQFHDSHPEGRTATVMVKLPARYADGPRVLVPYGQRPDNAFEREAADTERLWELVCEVLTS